MEVQRSCFPQPWLLYCSRRRRGHSKERQPRGGRSGGRHGVNNIRVRGAIHPALPHQYSSNAPNPNSRRRDRAVPQTSVGISFNHLHTHLFCSVQAAMGAGPRFPYPKHVYSPAGGWWVQPHNWKANTVVAGLGIAGVSYAIWMYSAEREWRHRAPNRWIPSMLWAKQFKDGELGIREI
ncbi:unnamed protein product [Jaminaea pallidilutea]